MKKNYSLVLIALLFAILSGYGQVAQFNFPSTNSLQVSFQDANISVSNMNLSSGTISTNITTGTYFPNEPYVEEGDGWNATSQAAAKNFNFTINADSGYKFTITNLSFRAYATGAGPSAFGFSIGSTDLYSVNAPNSGLVNVNEPISGQNNLTSTTIEIQGWLNGSRPSSGGGVFRLDDIIISGTVTPIAVADPNLAITGTSDHNSSCISLATTPIQYTITNSGVLQANGITITSDNPQFVVSGLSSTTIAPSGNATYNVTFTPTAVGAQNATLTVTSSTTTSNSPTIDLTGLGITTPTITTQPTNQNDIIPNAATFSVVSSNATSYQWQVSTNGGSTWTNAIGGTGATTDSYTTGATSAPMNMNQYQCVVTNSCGFVNSNAALLTLTNTPTSNVTGIKGCFEDNSVILNWTPPGTGAPTGYMVYALNGGTDPAGAKTDANTYAANSDFSLATPVTPASLGRVVYKGTATTATITGLTEDNNYSFTTYTYVGEALTGWSNGETIGSTVTNETAQGDVSNLVATPLTNQVNLNWNNPLPTSCFDQLIIVANEGPVVFTPTGTYANTNVNYTTPNTIMYSTTSTVSAKALSGLTNGTNYCFKVFIRRGATWSDGVEVCAVPSLSYCNAEGNTSFDTGITGVTFNTINNTGTSPNNAYTNFTSISTDVVLGNNYNLGVVINIDGAVAVYTRVWIDWNQNGSFNDSGEQYELGMDTNPNASIDLNTATANSPINVEVPNNAALGVTRMRVFNQYNSLPTSCATGNGGAAEDYTINIIQPVNAEMNIKGNNISIANSFNAPYGLNNTLFGSTNVGSAGPIKNFFVENIGATTLDLTGTPIVEIIGAHPGDFIVNQQAAVSITSASNSEFIIQFFPTADGTRTATVRIENTDSDEDPYEFDIEGTAICSNVLTSSIWPIEGPENTEVTITSVNDLTGATALINDSAMTIVSTNATALVILVPAGATSGNLEVLFTTGCSSTNTFTVIDTIIGGCETATSSAVPSDLFISEISDASTGSSSLVEIFNGTAGTIDLATYSIRVFNNGNASASATANLVGSLASGELHVISIGTTSCDLSATGLASGLPDQSFDSAGGINFDNNSSDMMQLFNGGTAIDAFGVAGSSTWANGLGINGDGVNYRRQNTTTVLPSTTFDITEWDEIDWATCGDSDYSNFGLYDFSRGIPPSVSVLSAPSFTCASSSFMTITGTEGVSSGLGLTYQWYYLAPNATTFVVVPNDANFNDVTTATLEIINNLPYNEYQFYCQVRENTAICYTASNAVKLVADGAIWDGTNWSTPPTINKIAVIDGNYDTSIGGPNNQTSFEVCQLIVNTGHTLNIENNTFVRVQNNLTVNGNIIIKTDGSFVHVDDLAIVDGDVLTIRDKISVEKETAQLATYQEYTYWSSPVIGELLNNGLAEASAARRFTYTGQNFRDSTRETNNDGATVTGQDDIDDDANDWQVAVGTNQMLPGVGYAATHNSIGFMPAAYIYTFEGAFNNGVFNIPIYRNDVETLDNNWNFIGNPYPSAIDADLFLAENASIDQGVNATDGAIFFWSHDTAADGTTNGNENLNYSQSDYAIINGTGQIAGGDGLVPTRHIPSGQGFFVSMDNASTSTLVSGTIRTTNVIFNNSMRVTGNNNQFFRTSNTTVFNKLRLNLTSGNGIFSQILVGYVAGATANDDGMYYDATRNLASNASSLIYSLIETSSDKKFAIQGKDTNSLTLDEVIPLGFYTSIDEATLYKFSIGQLEGDFMNNNTVYLRDYIMNITHDLSLNDYTFTSETGEFNDRFEIVFQPEALSVNENVLDPNDVTIVELGNGDVKFSVGKNIIIDTVEILDVLGRTIYKLRGQNSTETYNLSQLSQATYIARITLSNGQTFTNKAVKRF